MIFQSVNERGIPECEDAYYSYRDCDFFVVGNVHENPELLKK